MKRIIITADDFGLCEAIDRGIRSTLEAGVIRHVSLVANGKSAESASEYLRSCPNISIGIHLNLTDGKALSEKYEFAGNHWKVAWKYGTSSKWIAFAEREFRQQIERLLNFGISLSQINSHGHIHALPHLFRLVDRLAVEYQIPFIRIVSEMPDAKRIFSSPLRALKAMGVSALFLNGQGGVSRRIPAMGVYDAGCMTEKAFISLLDSIKSPLTEILCHPGSESSNREFNWNYRWPDEKNFFTKKTTLTLLKSHHLQPSSFIDL